MTSFNVQDIILSSVFVQTTFESVSKLQFYVVQTYLFIHTTHNSINQC